MLTTACNFRCAYCTQSRRAPRTMAPGVLDAAIRQLVSSRYERPSLVFYGGEPLLAAPLLLRALNRIRQWAPSHMRPDAQIITNGARLDEATTRLLVSRDVFITLSFDGVAPAQNDRNPGSFDLLDRLLVRLERDHAKHFRERFGVKVTLSSRNAAYLSESFRYFLSRGVRDVDIYPVLPDDAGWNARLRRALSRQLADVVRTSLEESLRSGRIPFRPFRGGAAEPRVGSSPCGCGSRSHLFVDVDGTVAACSRLAPSTVVSQPPAVRRAERALAGPHVTDTNLPAALFRRETRARRLRFLAGPATRLGPRGAPCARCKALSTCFVCPVAVACNGGRVPQFHCDVNRLFARYRKEFRRGLKE